MYWHHMKNKTNRIGSKKNIDSNSVISRRLAALCVKEVMEKNLPLQQVISSQKDYAMLESRDRAFVRLIVATTFRRMGQINSALKPFLRQNPPKLIYAALQTAAAQIIYLGTPPHAAVGETVAMLKGRNSSKGFANLTNAVLRKVVDSGTKLAAQEPPKINIPSWLLGEWESDYGRQASRKFSIQLTQEPPLDVTVKSNESIWADKLCGKIIGKNSVRINKIGNITELAGFSEGEWWAQDIAASIPVKLLGSLSGKRVLDMCAAPGGKTMQLASMGALVTALDKSISRLGRVKENLKRTNLSADIICQDALDWDSNENFYDAVLLDAPCTATGTFRRHPDVLYNRKPKDLSNLIKIQDQLLNKSASFVKPGGVLIYSTCSLLSAEGKPRIDKFLKRNPHFSLEAIKNIDGLDLPFEAFEGGFVRTLPHYLADEGGMDGFFIAKMKRSNSS